MNSNEKKSKCITTNIENQVAFVDVNTIVEYLNVLGSDYCYELSEIICDDDTVVFFHDLRRKDKQSNNEEKPKNIKRETVIFSTEW